MEQHRLQSGLQQDIGCHPAVRLSVADAQHLRTETVIAERLAWY